MPPPHCALQDTLQDLLLPRAKNSVPSADACKLEIKKDPKGMVTVMGATVVEVTSARCVACRGRHVRAGHVHTCGTPRGRQGQRQARNTSCRKDQGEGGVKPSSSCLGTALFGLPDANGLPAHGSRPDVERLHTCVVHPLPLAG